MLFKKDELNTLVEAGKVKRKRKRSKILKLGSPVDSCFDVIGEIKQGDEIDFMTQGVWSIHDLLEYFLEFVTGPAKAYCFTWSVSHKACERLAHLKNKGMITELNFIADRKMSKWKMESIGFLKGFCKTLRLAGIHAKGFLLINDDWKITCLSSANFTNNPRLESGSISTHKDIFDFHFEWVNRLLIENEELEFTRLDKSDWVKIPENKIFDKRLILIRGAPGTGKTTMAKNLFPDAVILENDDFFTVDNLYSYDRKDIDKAIGLCENNCVLAMAKNVKTIVICNVFGALEQLERYKLFAKKHGYAVFQIIKEKEHDYNNVHNISNAIIKHQQDKFEYVK